MENEPNMVQSDDVNGLLWDEEHTGLSSQPRNACLAI